VLGCGSAGPGVGELVSSPDRATGIAACVTIVRAEFDAGSVRLSVNMPTAATSPVVVCANLRIANEPVTCGVVAPSSPGVVGSGDVGGSAGGGVAGGSEGVVGGVVGGEVGGSAGAVGSVGVVGSVGNGVVGSTGGVGTAGVSSVPVTGMISLPAGA
jgi:hypothetical protein